MNELQTQTSDPLFRIFEEHLHQGLIDDEAPEVFVDQVVEKYITWLKTDSVFVMSTLAQLEADARLDVLDMLHKKTYGFFSLAQYRKARKNLR
jgi:hypothetical protein